VCIILMNLFDPCLVEGVLTVTSAAEHLQSSPPTTAQLHGYKLRTVQTHLKALDLFEIVPLLHS